MYRRKHSICRVQNYQWFQGTHWGGGALETNKGKLLYLIWKRRTLSYINDLIKFTDVFTAEHESQCSFHPKFLPECWGKAPSGSHPGAHLWASMALWARRPEPTIAVAHLQIKSCILPSQCCVCYHPYTCLQFKSRPALCPVPGLALMTTYRGCWLTSLVNHQPIPITLHSVSSACHALPFSAYLS